MEPSLGISVVIPCHNAERLVEDAVHSALGQTHPPAEIVCVDDGSSDATLEVLHNLSAAFPDRLRVVAQPRGGACAARNKGLSLVTGAYVQFLDADDELLPDKLSHQATVVHQHDEPDLVVGSYVRHQLDGSQLPLINQPMNPWVALLQKRMGITSVNLFKREALLHVGGWNEDYPSNQEYELMFRMLQAGHSVAFDPSPLTIIRQQPRSISNATPEANLVRRIGLVAEIREYARRHVGEGEVVDTADSVLFFLIRMRCNYNLQRGIDAFHEHFDDSYVPQVDRYITRTYARAYRLLGFPLTQRLRTATKRTLRRLRSIQARKGEQRSLVTP